MCLQRGSAADWLPATAAVHSEKPGAVAQFTYSMRQPPSARDRVAENGVRLQPTAALCCGIASELPWAWAKNLFPLEPLLRHPLCFTTHLMAVSTIEKGSGKGAAQLGGANL
jgi:hypothetical protein